MRRLSTMAGRHRISLGWLAKHLRNTFLLGILVIVPLGATVLILVWVFTQIDNILQPTIRSIWGQSFPGIGFGIVIILIYLAGIIASSFIGKKIIGFGETLLDRVPLVRQIYRGIKQVLGSYMEPRETGFMQVVFIEFPRKGVQSIGFITNEIYNKSGDQLFTVFVPTSPNPTSGFLQIVREDEITRTDITVADALRVVISAGRVPLETEGLMSES